MGRQILPVSGVGGGQDTVLAQDRLGGQALEALAEQVRVESHVVGGDAAQAQALEEEASGLSVAFDELVPRATAVEDATGVAVS